MCGYSAYFWNTIDRLRSRGALSLTRTPPMIMSPLVMSSRPTIIRSRVDFPQPDGPTRIMNSPSAMSRLTSLTAGKPSPYCFTMCRISIDAISSRPLGGSVMCSSLMNGARPESSLDRAVGEAGDDPPLEEQDQHDHGDGDDHRGRSDGPGRGDEL